jgi:hypothetical protein
MTRGEGVGQELQLARATASDPPPLVHRQHGEIVCEDDPAKRT